MAFSPTESAFEGFRLTRRSPMTIIIWALFFILMVAGILLLAGGALMNFMQVAEGLEGGGEPSPEQMIQLASAYFGFLGLVMPVSVILGSIIYAAANRAVVRPQESAFGYIRLGMDEVRVAIVSLVLGVVCTTGFGLVLGLFAGVVGIMAASLGEQGANALIIVAIVGGLAFVALAIWVSIRLSLAYAITVAERRIAIFDSLGLTKGHFWNLLGMFLLAYVLTMVVQILASIVIVPVLILSIGGLENLASLEAMAPMEIVRTMAPFAIIAVIFSALLSALQTAILYTPAASAYLALTGGQGAGPAQVDDGLPDL